LSIKNCSWLATKEHVPIMVMIDSNYMLFSSGTQQFVNSSDEEKKFGTSRHKKPIKASAGKNLRISWCGCVECTYCTKQKSEFLGGTIFLFFHFIFVLYLLAHTTTLLFSYYYFFVSELLCFKHSS
jgi:hypothetical protein